MAKKNILNGVSSADLVNNLNAEMVGGIKGENILPYHYYGRYRNGWLIKFKDIPGNNPYTQIHIMGHPYGGSPSSPIGIDSYINVALWSKVSSNGVRITDYKYMSNGYDLGPVTFLIIEDTCYLWISRHDQNYIIMSATNIGSHTDIIESVTDAECPEDNVSFKKVVSPKIAVHNETGSSFDHIDLPSTVKSLDINTLPPIANVDTIILRYNGVVQDLDTYVSQVEEPVMPLPMNDEVEVSAETPSTLELPGGLVPMTNLDEYIGTPNNWLKIYVPNNQLENYKKTYPTLSLYLYAINDKMPYNFSVGGTNLLRYTKDYKTLTLNKAELIENDYRGLTALHCKDITSSNVIVSIKTDDKILLDENEIYTLSFYAKGTVVTSSISVDNIRISTIIKSTGSVSTVSSAWNRQNLTSEYKKYFITFKTGSGGKGGAKVQFIVDPTQEVYICGVKLEKGTVPTDWSPALEDIDEQFEGTNSEIEEIKETYAKKDGAYEGLLAGTAMNLQGQYDVTISSMYQPTGGNLDVNWNYAELQNIKGNAVAWNQFNNQSRINKEVKIDNSNESEKTATYIDSGYGLDIVDGHKIYENIIFSKCVVSGRIYIYQNETKYLAFGTDKPTVYLQNNKLEYSSIGISKTFQEGEPAYTLLGIEPGASLDAEIKSKVCIDLTLIYGVGNEPTTPEQFEEDYQRWFGKRLTYEEYDEGSIRNVQATGIKTVGFNQALLTEFEGTLIQWSNKPLFINNCGYKGQMYIQFDIIKYDSSNNTFCYVEYTDSSISYLGTNSMKNNKLSFTTDKNKIVKEIKSIYYYNSPTEIKIENICINFVWSGSRNSYYELHWEETEALPITTLKGKLNGEEESVIVFPDGMKKADKIYDEIYVEDGVTKAIKRVGSITLDKLEYVRYNEEIKRFEFKKPIDALICAQGAWDIVNTLISSKYTRDRLPINDDPNRTDNVYSIGGSGFYIKDDEFTEYNEEFINLLKTITLYYELDKPEVYILDDFKLPLVYKIDDFGTEQIISPENSVTPILTTRYGVNAVDTLRRLPQNYVSERSINNLLYQLNSVMNGTWNKSWNSTTNSYDFSFVPNEVPDSSLPNEELP